MQSLLIAFDLRLEKCMVAEDAILPQAQFNKLGFGSCGAYSTSRQFALQMSRATQRWNSQIRALGLLGRSPQSKPQLCPSRPNRVTCWICFKPGHSTVSFHHRLNLGYQAQVNLIHLNYSP